MGRQKGDNGGKGTGNKKHKWGVVGGKWRQLYLNNNLKMWNKRSINGRYKIDRRSLRIV